MCIYEATATRTGNQKKIEVSQPNPERWSLYNQSCCHAFSGGILGLNTFVEGILRAAESSWTRCLTEREKTTLLETRGTKSKKETN
jgi:hypothetical protein